VRDLLLLGEERDEWESGFCGYQRYPGDIACARDAVWHGFVLDDPCKQIVAMMCCCDEHLAHMKLSADFIHRLKHPCCIPGAWFRWPENECYLDWDDGAELAQVALVQVSAPRLRALAPAERLV
jgi:hypothetical protein